LRGGRTGVEFTVEGTRHLGAATGTADFKAQFVKKKVITWVAAVRKISQIAHSQPHAAYAAFTHCLQRQDFHLPIDARDLQAPQAT